MYVVIFRAETGRLDATYDSLARELRDLALNEFGCLRFEASCEAGVEIAVSQPAWLTDSRLRPRSYRKILRCARTGCSPYCPVRLRARSVARLVFSGISTPSLRESVSHAG